MGASGYRLITFEELLIFVTAVVIFFALHFVGRAVLGGRAPSPILPTIGLAVIYCAFVAASYLLPGLPLIAPFLLLVVLAGIGFFRCRKTWIVDSTNLAISVVAGMPLTALAIVVYEPLWDDMTHWLVSAQFLFRQSHLPTAVEPIINSSHAIYPYARAMLHAWVNSVNGNFTVNVQGIFNCLFLSSTFQWLPIWIEKQRSGALNQKENISLIAAASLVAFPWAAMLGATVVVSSYADPVFAICFLHIFVLVIVTDDIDKLIANHRNGMLQFSLLLLTPIVIKQSGIYLVGILASLIFVFHSAERLLSGGAQVSAELIRTGFRLCCACLPALLGYFLWAAYADLNLLPKSFGVSPLGEWNFDVVDQIFLATLIQFNGRPYAPLAVILIVALLLWSYLRRRPGLRQLSKVAGMAVGFFFACYFFQFAAYISVFSKFEASKAASLVRYMAPAGLIVFVALGMLLMRGYGGWSRSRRMAVAWSLFTVGTLVTLLASSKIVPEQRVDLRLKDIASVIRDMYPAGEDLTLLDIRGNGFAATAVRFYLDGYMPTNYRTLYPDANRPVTDGMLKEWQSETDHVYVMSGPPSLYAAIGITSNEIETATNLMNSYPKGVDLILVDAVSDGTNARHLAMLLQWHFRIHVKTSIDLVQGDRDELLKLWQASASHVHFVSSNRNIITWLNGTDSNISFSQ